MRDFCRRRLRVCCCLAEKTGELLSCILFQVKNSKIFQLFYFLLFTSRSYLVYLKLRQRRPPARDGDVKRARVDDDDEQRGRLAECAEWRGKKHGNLVENWKRKFPYLISAVNSFWRWTQILFY